MSQTRDHYEPDERNFPEGFEGTELQLAHFSKEEAKTYDLLQNPQGGGEPFIDDELQIRSYAPLGELIKEKGFRDFFLAAAREESDPQQAMPDFKHFHAQGSEAIKEIPWEPAPGDEIPEIKEMAKNGRGGDSIMVYMPSNMVYLLGLVRGEVSLNPMTGWVEFGWKVFKNIVNSVVRVGATVAGAVAGGPLGAAAGSAVGSALTGRRTRDWLPVAGKSAMYATAANALQGFAPQLAGSGIPGATHLGSGLQALPQVPGFSAGMANMGLGSLNPFGGGTTSAVPGSSIPGSTIPGGFNPAAAAPGVVNQVGMQTAAQGAPQAAAQGSFLSSPLVQLGLPAAMNIGAGLMARNADKEQAGIDKRNQEDQLRRQDERDAEWRRRTGHDRPLESGSRRKRINPRYMEPGEPYYLYEGDERYDRHAYKKGGSVGFDGYLAKKEDEKNKKIEHKEHVSSGVLLKGPGDGISDSIHTKVPENTFIVRAHAVSMFGNGDSSAGERGIKEYLSDLERQYSESQKAHFSESEQRMGDVLVALSAGEIPIFPRHVYMTGDGNLHKGLDKWDNFQKNVTAHKKIKKDGLPPSSKDIEEYME